MCAWKPHGNLEAWCLQETALSEKVESGVGVPASPRQPAKNPVWLFNSMLPRLGDADRCLWRLLPFPPGHLLLLGRP